MRILTGTIEAKSSRVSLRDKKKFERAKQRGRDQHLTLQDGKRRHLRLLLEEMKHLTRGPVLAVERVSCELD